MEVSIIKFESTSATARKLFSVDVDINPSGRFTNGNKVSVIVLTKAYRGSNITRCRLVGEKQELINAINSEFDYEGDTKFWKLFNKAMKPLDTKPSAAQIKLDTYVEDSQ